MNTIPLVIFGVFIAVLALFTVKNLTDITTLPLANITDSTNENLSFQSNLTLNGTIILNNLSGTGNSFLCINSTGQLYRNASCG